MKCAILFKSFRQKFLALITVQSMRNTRREKTQVIPYQRHEPHDSIRGLSFVLEDFCIDKRSFWRYLDPGLSGRLSLLTVAIYSVCLDNGLSESMFSSWVHSENEKIPTWSFSDGLTDHGCRLVWTRKIYGNDAGQLIPSTPMHVAALRGR